MTGRAQSSAYFNAITNLNPVGYWPMHEMEPAVQGDIETNYGSLGPLGAGFYPDWVKSGSWIQRQFPGALAGDSDAATYFLPAGYSISTPTYTNSLYVPHTSPLSTLNPPFSVECWYYPTNNSQGDIWSQNGFEGLNAGGTSGGAGKVCGIRLDWGNSGAGFEIFSYCNSSTLYTLGQTFTTSLGQWYHLVVTCDTSTNIILYVDGVSKISVSAIGKYSPDYWMPFVVANGRGNTRPGAGIVDEVAVYTNVLSASAVANHYDIGINAAPPVSYFNTVMSSNPVIYLRMDAPAYVAPSPATWPVLTNDGSVAVNGFYNPDTMPGIVPGPANPVGTPFTGLSGATVAQLSGVSSFADAGYAAVYNPVGPISYSVSAMFRGDPCDGRVQTIVGHSDNSWRILMNATGTLQCQLGTNTSSQVNSVGVYNDGDWHQVVDVYTTNSNPTLPGTNALYVDGVLDSMTNGVTPNGILPGTNTDVTIGAALDYTNNPNGVGRQFAGQICEVALFTNSLTVGQIQTLYYTTEQGPPFIKTQPSSATVNGGPGSAINFSVSAGGLSPAYQWYFNTSSNYSGATALANNGTYANTTTTQLTVTNLSGANSGYYFVIVTNSFGSVTSLMASLTINTAPIIISQFPVPYTNPFTLYAGANPAFSISVSGAQPIHYNWFTNGVRDAAASSSNMVWANVAIGSITNFCVVTNSLGSITSAVWVAAVVADPAAPYPQAVLALNPIGYWRLNDTNLDGVDNGGPGGSGNNGNGDDGWVVNDYASGNDGLYTNVSLGNPGYNPTTDPLETSAEFGETGISFADSLAGWINGVDFAAPNGSNGEFTVEAWADNISSAPVGGAAAASEGTYGVSDQFALGIDTSAAANYRFYVRSAAGTVYTADSSFSSASTGLGNWVHLAGVCDEANGIVSLYINGQLAASTSIPTNSGVYEPDSPMTIGCEAPFSTYQFYGYINDVSAFNYALSANQIGTEYVSAGVPPTVSPAPPANVDANGGGALVIPAIVSGTPVMGYSWYDEHGGTNVAAGTTNGGSLNATLTVNNVPANWNGDTLELTVTNAYGQNTYPVSLTVYQNPAIVTLQLPSPVTVVQGNSYVYSVGADGVPPLYYQWFNGTMPISNATNASYTVTAGAPGGTTYSVVVSNLFGVVTSTVSAFTSISANPPSLTSGYETNLLLLNPAGYWPMHEVESPAHGDIEANYGSLGLLGTGYYPDWLGAPGIQRDAPGALVGESDAAVYFNFPSSDAGFQTNAMYVPHTSPVSTLNPPFSVECWFYPTNNNQGDIWSQSGFEGLNAGATGGGAGNVCGIRLDWNTSSDGFEIFSYCNSNTLNTLGQTGTTPLGQWYHLVVNCDASTNITLYVNSVSEYSVAAAGEYSPDYWMPFEVGNGRGNSRAVAGIVDEVAVYTNVLSTGEIGADYAAGTNGSPGQYFQDVMNDNPVIYLRMDSPTYVVPSTNFWPVLFNYGSTAGNGLYTPGTMPGIVPGPSTNANGIPFSGLPSAGVAQLSGVSSFADAGYANAYNPTGATSFSVSAMFRGNPCDGRLQTIAGHSDNSWRMMMNTNGTLQCQLGTNASSVVNSVGVYNDGNWHQAVEVYTPNPNPALAGTHALFVDGALSAMTNGVSPNGILPGTNVDVLIGSDPEYTNNPAGLGRQFAGQICEVAFFTNALTAGQIAALYLATETNRIPAYFAPAPPAIASAAPGGTLSVTAGVAGTAGLGYQWQIITNSVASVLATGSGSGVPLNATLAVGSVPVAWNGGQLELTVTNAYGTNTAFVVLSLVSANPTNIVFAVTDNQLTLSWPADHIGWLLQAQTNRLSVGISTNWVNVNGSTTNNQVVVPINLTNGSVFYRLVYP